jgi:hypothetical protein
MEDAKPPLRLEGTLALSSPEMSLPASLVITEQIL